MGYDMHMKISVTPDERFDEVSESIVEAGGPLFEWNNEWCYGGSRWANITNDMKAVSLKHPGVQMEILCEGEDGEMWNEYFMDGKTYIRSRPHWDAPDFDQSELR